MSTFGQILPSNADEFVRRFGRLDDGYMNELLISRKTGTAKLELMLRDSENPGQWVILTAIFEEIRYSIYNQGPRGGMHSIITEGINVREFNIDGVRYLFFDFAPVHTDELCSVESMYDLTMKQFFESDGLIVAKSARWEITPMIDQ